jgi:hypothetical protein
MLISNEAMNSQRVAARSLAPLLRGEGWGEGRRASLALGRAETPPHRHYATIRPLPARGER